MQIITREEYAHQIDSWIGKEQIIVIIGGQRIFPVGIILMSYVFSYFML